MTLLGNKKSAFEYVFAFLTTMFRHTSFQIQYLNKYEIIRERKLCYFVLANAKSLYKCVTHMGFLLLYEINNLITDVFHMIRLLIYSLKYKIVFC